jgi:hypothetical protein
MSDILKKLNKEELEFLMNLAKQGSVPKIEEPIIVEEVKEVEKQKEEVEEPKYPTEEQKRRYEERMEKIQDYLTPMEREEYFIEQWEAFWKRVEVKPVKLPIGIRMQFENLREVYNHFKLIQGTNHDDATFVIKRDKIEGLEYSQMDPAHIQLLAVFFDKYSTWLYEVIEDYIIPEEGVDYENPRFTIDLKAILSHITSEDLKSNSGVFLEANIKDKKFKIWTNTFEAEYEMYETYNDVPIPKIDLPRIATIDLKRLNDAIKKFDEVKFYVKDYKLIAEVKDEFATKRAVISEVVESNVNGIEAVYSAEYLSNFLNYALKLTKEAELKFNKNMPLQISFKTSIAKVDYFLAPRYEN